LRARASHFVSFFLCTVKTNPIDLTFPNAHHRPFPGLDLLRRFSRRGRRGRNKWWPRSSPLTATMTILLKGVPFRLAFIRSANKYW